MRARKISGETPNTKSETPRHSPRRNSVLFPPLGQFEGWIAHECCNQFVRPVGRLRHPANNEGEKQVYGVSAASLGHARNGVGIGHLRGPGRIGTVERQPKIEYYCTRFGETVQVRFKLFMEDNIAGFHPKTSMIPRLFVLAGKHEGCIRRLVDMPAEDRSTNCLPHAHPVQYAPSEL